MRRKAFSMWFIKNFHNINEVHKTNYKGFLKFPNVFLKKFLLILCSLIWRIAMARHCVVTGKKPMVGNNVSHANNRTKRRFLPNLQWKKFWVPELKKWVRLRVTAKAIKTIDKKGISAVLREINYL